MEVQQGFIEKIMKHNDLKLMQYNRTLHFKNNSVNKGDFCIYQKLPDSSRLHVMSLAWLSLPAEPTTHLKFDWTEDYSFVWSETGVLAPGVMFKASQVWKADLTKANHVGFRRKDDTYTFEWKDLIPRTVFAIDQDNSIPMSDLSVGMGMSGSGVFATQAQPQSVSVFVPHPEYWIVFGDYKKGVVLDFSEMKNVKNISFPESIYSLEVTLNKDNTWSVKPDSSV